MKKYFCCRLGILFFVINFVITANAQIPEKEVKKKFDLVLISCGENVSIQFYKFHDGKGIEAQYFKLKNTEEAKNIIETLASEAKEIIERQNHFSKIDNATVGRYVLLFENNKDKTAHYKIAKFFNEYIVIITASSIELAREFEKSNI
jgi:hypothetical protein